MQASVSPAHHGQSPASSSTPRLASQAEPATAEARPHRLWAKRTFPAQDVLHRGKVPSRPRPAPSACCPFFRVTRMPRPRTDRARGYAHLRRQPVKTLAHVARRQRQINLRGRRQGQAHPPSSPTTPRTSLSTTRSTTPSTDTVNPPRPRISIRPAWPVCCRVEGVANSTGTNLAIAPCSNCLR